METKINNNEKEIESLRNKFENLQSKNLIRSIENSSQPAVVIDNKQGNNRNEIQINIDNSNNNNKNINEISNLNDHKLNNASGNTLDMMLGGNNNNRNNIINISESNNNIINDIADKNLIKEEEDEFESSKKSDKKDDNNNNNDNKNNNKEREPRGNLPIALDDDEGEKSNDEFNEFEEVEEL